MTATKNIRVLLIDDDEDDYIITRDLLTAANSNIGEIDNLNFILDWVYTYADGWELLSLQHHDVYLIDYRLGERSGLDLLYQAIAQAYSCPIILLTGIDDRAIDIEAMQAGAVDYLIKDQLTPSILERSIRYAIELSRREATVKRLSDQHKRLFEASQAITSTLNLEEVLTLIGKQMVKAIDVTSAYICDINAEQHSSTVLAEYLSPHALPNEQKTDLGQTYYLEDTFSEQFKDILAGRPEIIHIEDLKETHFYYQHMQTYQAKSILFIALQLHGRTIAYAQLWESRKKRVFSSEEIFLCQSIAQQATIALENAQLYEQAQQEIIERKKIEHALRQSEQEFETLLNSISDYVWSADIINGQVKYRYYSPIIEKVTGYPVEYFMSGPDAWLNIIHPQDKQTAIEEVGQEMLGKQVVHEYRIITLDGQLKWLFGTTSPTFNEAGEVVRLDGVVSDITERKRLELQLRQSQKIETIGTLAGGIAHDFNNILTPILGFTEISLRETAPENPQHKRLQQVYKATQRAKELVEQILTFSRNVEDDHVPLHLNSVIKEALTLIRATIPTTISIDCNFNEQSGAILGNPTQIHQVLVNLCANAYHAMQETGGTIKINMARVDGKQATIEQNTNLNDKTAYIHLSVSDTGHGMNQATIDRIFEPFFTTKDIGEGTGLGLSVVHGIVLNHKGEIVVESEAGVGSTFHIYLPAIEQATFDEAPNEEAIAQGKEHILFVDDEEAITVMSQHLLESLGYKVSVTTSSATALELFKGNPKQFDLVITDQTMPHLTGLELAQKLIHLRPDLPIIITSGFSEKITPEIVDELGIRDYIIKPFNAQDLNKVIRNALTNQ